MVLLSVEFLKILYRLYSELIALNFNRRYNMMPLLKFNVQRKMIFRSRNARKLKSLLQKSSRAKRKLSQLPIAHHRLSIFRSHSKKFSLPSSHHLLRSSPGIFVSYAITSRTIPRFSSQASSQFTLPAGVCPRKSVETSEKAFRFVVQTINS